jgi:hypothetical protein
VEEHVFGSRQKVESWVFTGRGLNLPQWLQFKSA